MSTTTATRQIVALQYNTLNTSVLEVTPLADGMERVEYLGHHTTAPADLMAVVDEAKTMATVTGSRSASYERDGVRATWYRNAYAAPRRAMGVHRAPSAATGEQAALAAEQATQHNTRPEEGGRWVVGVLTGYQPVQDRPFEHRECSCGNGTTTYYAGVISGVTYWMDNSVDVTVQCEDGITRTVQTTAPHGDVCF